jgi:hypothetical protein
MQYQALANVQAFSTSFDYVENGYNLAFVVQNKTNEPGYEGLKFQAGAGGE